MILSEVEREIIATWVFLSTKKITPKETSYYIKWSKTLVKDGG